MKAIKTIIKTSLVASTIFTTFCTSDSFANTNQKVKQSRDSCIVALENVEARIKGNNYMSFKFKPQAISNEWRKGSMGRSIQLRVILGGLREGSEKRVANVMSSPRMLTEMSKQLIESCINVAAVTYGINNTGSSRTFGTIDGVVREFDYVEPNRRNPDNLRWGLDF